ncbi:interleukin-1 receptor type 1-like isoform X2 [Anguilla anguilla]|uniref:interleukin-1 receptor type 1-like isoform X2 n=1 Tax=Anguilla anguilla TaxID=7936 RepID=UPI0015B21C6C|nr:interleukin-1 receptor type 1-like isoform X2 [Anguilla anguilla]
MSQMLPILLAAAACLHGIVAVKADVCVSPPSAEHCKDYETQFDRVFTVPGDAAVLNCTLASPDVFDLNSTPYNISWYECKTGRELSGEGGQFRVRETSLWLLNSTLEDAGQYECILRTPNGCFKQKSVLRVDPAKAGDCRRPHMAVQSLTTIANGYLVCPLNTYMSLVDSYSIQWYKGCEPVVEGDKFSLMRENKLLLRHVVANDTGHYTCRMTFNLTGTIGHAAETIECNIKDDWNMRPIVYQPMNETVKADYGGHFNKTCRVFVPSKGKLWVDVYWASEEDFISMDLSDRVHQVQLSKQKVNDGVWLEVLINFTKVKEEDFNQTYTCMVFSDKGVVTSIFTLQPSDPNFMIPLALLFVVLTLTFLTSVTAYKIFKIDIVLWCRSYLPYFYTSSGSDGKAYDAYVVYPRMCWNGLHGSAETFVIHTLPQVLEKKCGYKLFIYSRDSLPGEAVVDSVQENICKSRRLMLLYTASTFSELGSPLRFEQEIGMHVALVEGTLQVILVELEEVTDYSLFPESVLHLKSKQGALQWWKTARETTGGPQICPSSRFWKQVRYRMPVKSTPVSSLPKHGCWMFNGP